MTKVTQHTGISLVLVKRKKNMKGKKKNMMEVLELGQLRTTY